MNLTKEEKKCQQVETCQFLRSDLMMSLKSLPNYK